MHLSRNATDGPNPEQVEAWIREAKQGDAAALGCLLQACQVYLHEVATREISAQLRVKCAPSDLVQETSLDAHRGFASFRGDQFEELLAWLRQILLWNAVSAQRRFGQAAKRRMTREVPLEALEVASTRLLDEAASPRSLLSKAERQSEVERALDQLPKDQKTAIVLRSRDHLSFAEVGARMRRSPEAVRKLWFRGVERLRQLLLNSDVHDRE